MVIANVETEKYDNIQVKDELISWKEAMFIVILLNNTMYLHLLNQNKKLLTDEYEVICIKKFNSNNIIIQVLKCNNVNELFILEKDMVCFSLV